MKCLLGKDSTVVHKEFKEVFDFFDKVMQEGLPLNEFGQ